MLTSQLVVPPLFWLEGLEGFENRGSLVGKMSTNSPPKFQNVDLPTCASPFVFLEGLECLENSGEACGKNFNYLFTAYLCEPGFSPILIEPAMIDLIEIVLALAGGSGDIS